MMSCSTNRQKKTDVIITTVYLKSSKSKRGPRFYNNLCITTKRLATKDLATKHMINIGIHDCIVKALTAKLTESDYSLSLFFFSPQ